MQGLKFIVGLSAILVLVICVYAFLLGNKVFSGKFENDFVGWYFLAKGIFCSLSLLLSYRIIEILAKRG